MIKNKILYFKLFKIILKLIAHNHLIRDKIFFHFHWHQFILQIIFNHYLLSLFTNSYFYKHLTSYLLCHLNILPCHIYQIFVILLIESISLLSY